MTLRIALVTVLAALAIAAIGAGGAVGVMLWEPWANNGEEAQQAVPTATPDTPRLNEQTPTATSISANATPTLNDAAEPTPSVTQTPYQRRLTGVEAAAIVQSAENTVWDEWGATEGFDLGSDCVTVDFNESIKAWIVQCSDFAIDLSSGTRIEQETRAFRLFDESGEYQQVAP